MNTLPEPVKSLPSPMVVRGVSILLIAAALGVAVMDEKTPGDPIRRRGIVTSDYESSWRRTTHVDLARTIEANHVEACAEMAYRPHRTREGEFLVYCSDSGRKWAAWLAFTSSQKVAGPYPIDPLLPLP